MFYYNNKTGCMRAVGYVPRDAEIKTTGTGKQLCSFSMKIYEKEENGERSAQWQDCTAWANSAAYGLATQIRKGDIVAVDGQLRKRTYEKMEGGETVTKEASDLTVEMLTIQQQYATTAAKPMPPTQDNFVAVDDEDDELPF